MTLRVSLQIDGEATGGIKAANDMSRAVDDLAGKTSAASKRIEEGFSRASGSAAGLANASKAQGAANDNAANSAANYAQKIGDIATKALGAESALARAASGAGSFISKFAEVAGATSKITFLTGAIGLAVSAAQTLFAVIQTGGRSATVSLEEQERLIGAVRNAYNDAANTAGRFYDTSKSITQLRLLEQEQKLREQLQNSAGGALGGMYGLAPMQQDGNILGNYLSGTKQVKEEFAAFEDAIFKLQAGFKDGTPDVKAFMDEVGRIALANPQLQQAGLKLSNLAQQAEEDAKRLRLTQDGRAVIEGRATPSQRENVLGRSQGTTANEFDRLTKSIDKQAAALEAETASIGKSAGETAKMRAELMLLEAAKQAGIKVSGKYADELERVASRIGAASQKAAEARLMSDVGFERGQLGRTSTEAAVADRLRSAFGDNVEPLMNSATASAIRFNETMRDLRSTTYDLASGAMRDFRSELQNGATAWEAFQKAGSNALSRLADKLLDQALQSGLSRLFGGILGIGGGVGGGTGFAVNPWSAGGMFGGGGFAGGGFTGWGGKYEPAGFVHRGEYVFDAESTRAAGVGTLDRMRRSLRGYADGGYVSDANVVPFRSAGNQNGSSAASASRVEVNINDNRTVQMPAGADEATMRRVLDQSNADLDAKVRNTIKTMQQTGELR